jgi:hypothetical protein
MRLRYASAVNPLARKQCPFCGHDKPLAAEIAAGDGKVQFVKCPECGVFGPQAGLNDPPGHAAHLWNLRHGAKH